MNHPKHREQPKRKSGSPIALTALVVLAAFLAILFWMWPYLTTPTSPCCTPDPVAPAAPVNNDYLNHVLVAQAICDHQPVWNEDPKRRVVVVSARPTVKIHSVEIRDENHRLLAASVRLGTLPKDEDQTTMRVYGAFEEAMHGARLEVNVQYIVKGLKFETTLHCPVQVIN